MTHFVFFETPPDVLERTAPLRADLAALQMQWALIKLAHKYRPDQPRVPAGNTDGGQWTYAGGVRVAANDRGGRTATDVLPSGTTNSRPTVNLMDEERAGGHAIGEHVGKSATNLMNRVNQKKRVETPFATFDIIPERAGSFPSVSAAEKLTNSTLAQSPMTVSMVANGLLSNALVTANFDSKTGIEAFRPSARAEPYIRDTYGVGVVIRHDSSGSRGYRVVTAYPRNE